jgi:hypothetical protein
MPGELRDKGMGERWSPPVDGRWTLRADLYVDCTGLRAKLIGEALQVPFTSCGDSLLTNRAVTCQVPNDRPGSPIASYLIEVAAAMIADFFPWSGDFEKPGRRFNDLMRNLGEWRYRPPCRFDFVADHETFPHFSYQYVLYGMGFKTSFGTARSRYGASHSAQRTFKQIRRFAQQAVHELPAHRTLIEQIHREGFRGKPSSAGVSSAGRNR